MPNIIDPCMANERRATNGSPASRHLAPDRPIIDHANINKPRSFAIAILLLTMLVGHVDPSTKCNAAQWPNTRIAGPFVIRADFSLTNYSPLIRQLGQLQNDLVRTLGVHPAREQINVYLFRNDSRYRRFLNTNFPNIAYRRALYIKINNDPGIVLAYRSSELPVDLRHECTHALLHAVLPVVPLWLDEGLAEYFEAPPSDRKSKNPHMSSTKWSVRLGYYENLEDLEQLQDFSKMTKSDYRNAWAWVHFMLHGPMAVRRELPQFLADIQANTPPGLLSHRFSRQIPHLNAAFRNHFRNWR